MSYQIQNNFSGCKVDTDSAQEYVAPNTLVVAENVDLLSQGEDLVIHGSKGNYKVTDKGLKIETFFGSAEYRNKTYRFTRRANDGDAFINEYDSVSGTETTVIHELNNTNTGFPNTTDPNLNTYVLSADVVDGDFLYWTWGVRGTDGELSGFGEPKRINIPEAKANINTYSNFTGNYDKPSQLLISSYVNSSITNNKLKYGSYIFYKRYTTKYDERTILSYPSICVNVSEVFGNFAVPNTISVGGFTVGSDIVQVEVFMSNASDNTFSIIKNIDTSVNKTVNAFEFTNSNEYPVLDSKASDIINNNFPLTATEQVLADNVLCYADIEANLKYEDINGNKLDKSIPFVYTATGLEYKKITLLARTPAVAGVLTVNTTFVDGSTYKFIIESYWLLSNRTYEFNYTHDATNSYIAALSYLFASKDPLFVVTDPATGNHHFTVSGLDSGSGLSSYLTIENVYDDNSQGLNSDFSYQYGIVFLDDKGRNAGVSNITTVNYSGDKWTFSIKPNLSISGITPPYWATNYMFVRDKVNTNLSYSLIGAGTTSAVKSGYSVHQVETQLYTNYFFDERGNSITVYVKDFKKDVNVIPLTVQDRTKETLANADADEYLYIKNDVTITDGGLILHRPNKSIDSKTEVFFETSDIFGVSSGVFDGDLVDKLNSYDTSVGFYDKTFSTSKGNKDVIVMKTDKISLSDINHLGRGAYQYLQDIDDRQNATIVHSQPYSPQSNYNGLSDVSYIYNNVIDLDRSYGSIEKLFFDDTNLRVGQKRKWTKILINKSMISTASGSGVLQSSGSFFNRPVIPQSGDFGITDKRSFADYGFRRFAVDQNNGAITRISRDGVTVINALRNDEIIKLLQSHSIQQPIIGGYNIDKDEYIVILYGSNRVLRFSGKTGESVGDYKQTILPYKYIQLNSKMYTSTQSSDDNLWLEEFGLGGTFYGNNEKKKIAYVVNLEPNIIKDYISMSINGYMPQSKDMLAGSVFDFDVTIETQKNKTTLNQDDFQVREGVWYADFMQDENSDGASYLGVSTVDTIIDTTNITLKAAPSNLNVGSLLYKDSNLIGEVKTISGTQITFTANMTFTPAIADFVHTIRDAKIEGESIKGNTAVVTIEITDNYNRSFTDDWKIFSVTINVNISSNMK